MRDFMLSNLPMLLWAAAALELVMFVLFLRKYSSGKKPLYLLSALVTVGLLYDAFMLAMGSVVQDGAMFAAFSRIRFVAHGALIPLLFPICAYALDWKKWLKTVVWIITGVIIALGIAEGFATVLELKEIGGVIRYTGGEGTPAWASLVSNILTFGTVIPLILAGINAWIIQKNARLFLSGFLMFAFSALGPATGNLDLNFFITMAGELLMVLFFYLYANKKYSGKSKKIRKSKASC